MCLVQMAILRQTTLGLLSPDHMLRPTMDPSKCPPEMAALIAWCWATRADDRPQTFGQAIYTRMHALQKKHTCRIFLSIIEAADFPSFLLLVLVHCVVGGM